MAERGNGLVGLGKVANHVENLGVEAQILGRAAAGNDEAVVVRGIDLVEGGIEREVVAALFGVGLIALEVVNRGANLIAFLLAGTDGVNGVAHHLQRLKRNHDLVVLNKIAGQQQELCMFHVRIPPHQVCHKLLPPRRRISSWPERQLLQL